MRRIFAIAVALMLATTAQAQGWKFYANEKLDKKVYVVSTTKWGSVYGCHRKTGKARIQFVCESKDWKIRPRINIQACDINNADPVMLDDLASTVSLPFNNYLNMPAKGSLVSLSGNAEIFVEPQEVSRFHALVFGNDGDLLLDIGLVPGVRFGTEHYFTDMDSVHFHHEFSKFPHQCSM